MDTNHPLFNLSRLMDNNPHIDWSLAMMNVKVYTRHDGDAGDGPYYYERTHKVVQPGMLLRRDEADLRQYLGIHDEEDMSLGNHIHIPNPNAGICDRDQGRDFYYPQLDFAAAKLTPGDIYEVRQQSYHDLSLYESGRSFHAYGRDLMTHDEWTRYMGRLLLVNKVGQDALVDWRWIGHSLECGQSFMRFTSASPRYKKVPSYIGEDSDLWKRADPLLAQ